MFENLREIREQILANGLLAQVFAIAGFLLALFMVARLMSQKRAPANTFAWLLIIVLVPWVGVPLYLLLGGRKLKRLAEKNDMSGPPCQPPLPLSCPPATHRLSKRWCRPVERPR
jgi:cardiolipin synthase A/B